MVMMTPQQVIENFEYLDDWNDRYEYLEELGKYLPPIDDKLRIDENRVMPCMSKVWVIAVRDAEKQEWIRFSGDCDTSIIKGVLALLIGLMSNRTIQEIDDMNIDFLFERLKLGEHLSPNRHVGIYAIVEVMKTKAHEL